jgi:hypothetical protein
MSFSPSLPPSQAEAVTGDAYKKLTANGFLASLKVNPLTSHGWRHQTIA